MYRIISKAVIDIFFRSSSISNGINPKYLSKSGAFNGTGLAIASYSFGTGGYGIFNVYFQHWTGQIRKLELLDDGSWEGGDETNIVATDAKNATPISAVAYAMDDVAVVSQLVDIITGPSLTRCSGTYFTLTRRISFARKSAIIRRTYGSTARLAT